MALLSFALQDLGLRARTISVQAPFAVRSLFLHLGWQEVGTVDFDLAEWTDKLSGFGLYRWSILVRYGTPVS
jgi:hypothetical protein